MEAAIAASVKILKLLAGQPGLTNQPSHSIGVDRVMARNFQLGCPVGHYDVAAFSHNSVANFPNAATTRRWFLPGTPGIAIHPSTAQAELLQ